MKEEILKLLRESDGFVSGQSALRPFWCIQNGCTGRVVRQLIQEGYRDRGYKPQGVSADEKPRM